MFTDQEIKTRLYVAKMATDNVIVAATLANDESLSLADLVGLSNKAKLDSLQSDVNADDNDSLLFGKVGESHVFTNRSTAFKAFKRQLRMEHKTAPDDKSHNKTTRVTVWSQRRAGKKRLAERAKIKSGLQFEFAYNADYSKVTVKRTQ